MRQASEGGRRHDEIMKREQQDEVRACLHCRPRWAAHVTCVCGQVFRQIMATHTGTVDSYLQDIITETVAAEAREQVTCDVQMQIAACDCDVCAWRASGCDVLHRRGARHKSKLRR